MAYNILVIGIWLGVAVLAYMGGVLSKALADKYSWRAPPDADPKDRTLYDVTLSWHAMIVTALIGIAPLPVWKVIEDLGGWQECAARIGWFALAGVFCSRVYEGLDNVIENLDDKVLDAIANALKLAPTTLPKRSTRASKPPAAPVGGDPEGEA